MQAPKVTQGAQSTRAVNQQPQQRFAGAPSANAPVNRTSAGQLAPEVRVVVVREQAPQQPQQQPQQPAPTGNQRTASAALLGAVVGAGVAGGLLLARLFS